MAQISAVDVRCPKCRRGSKSEIFVGDTELLRDGQMDGNSVRCKHCGHQFVMTKSDMVITLATGKVISGDDLGRLPP